MEQELIPERMPGRRLVVRVELDGIKPLIGVRAHPLGIPIFKMHHYAPPPGLTDGYEAVRNWYRSHTAPGGALSIVHYTDVQKALSNAQPDALAYLITEDEAERATHEAWCEPTNEAVKIGGWVFPANGVNKAVVDTDFQNEIIIVCVFTVQGEVDRIYYFVDQKEHTITYSHHYRGKKPAPQKQA